MCARPPLSISPKLSIEECLPQLNRAGKIHDDVDVYKWTSGSYPVHPTFIASLWQTNIMSYHGAYSSRWHWMRIHSYKDTSSFTLKIVWVKGRVKHPLYCLTPFGILILLGIPIYRNSLQSKRLMNIKGVQTETSQSAIIWLNSSKTLKFLSLSLKIPH